MRRGLKAADEGWKKSWEERAAYVSKYRHIFQLVSQLLLSAPPVRLPEAVREEGNFANLVSAEATQRGSAAVCRVHGVAVECMKQPELP